MHAHHASTVTWLGLDSHVGKFGKNLASGRVRWQKNSFIWYGGNRACAFRKDDK